MERPKGELPDFIKNPRPADLSERLGIALYSLPWRRVINKGTSLAAATVIGVAGVGVSMYQNFSPKGSEISQFDEYSTLRAGDSLGYNYGIIINQVNGLTVRASGLRLNQMAKDPVIGSPDNIKSVIYLVEAGNGPDAYNQAWRNAEMATIRNRLVDSFSRGEGIPIVSSRIIPVDRLLETPSLRGLSDSERNKVLNQMMGGALYRSMIDIIDKNTGRVHLMPSANEAEALMAINPITIVEIDNTFRAKYGS